MIADSDVQLSRRGFAGRFALAAVSAAIVGFTEAFSPGSALDGVIAAVLFGAAWGLTRALGLARRIRALGRLTRAEAAQVMRAVDAGSCPDDPRLAEAVLVRAEQVRSANYPRPLLMIVALGLLPLGLLITAIVTRQPMVLAFQGISVGLWQGTMRLDHHRDRDSAIMAAEFSARRARAVLGLPLTAAPTATDLLRERYDAAHPGWYRALVSVAVTTVISVFTGAATADTDGSDTHHFTAAELRKDSYRQVGSLGGTQFFVQLAKGKTLRIRTIGSVEQSCDLATSDSPSGPYVPVGTDVCDRLTSSVVAYVVDNTFHSARVGVSGGADVTSRTTFDIGAELPNERLMVAVLPSDARARYVMFH